MPLLGGVRPPIAALLCALLVVAAFFAVGLGTVHQHDVPQAVSDAERQIAADAALSVATSVNARATALRRTTASLTPAAGSTPAQVMKSLPPARSSAGRSVQGGVLLAPDTGKRLAAGGEPVPLTGLDVAALARPDAGEIAPRLVTSANGTPRLLLFARVTVPARGHDKDENADQAPDLNAGPGSGERAFLLVVSEKLLAPQAYGGGRTGQLLDRNGKVLATTAEGGPARGDTGAHHLLAAVTNAANAGPRTAGSAGSLLGDSHHGLRRVAGWASVAAADGKDETSGLGLTVLTFRDVPPAKGGPDYTRFALVAAAALVVIAALVTVALWGAVQRPLLRLHLSAARLAKGASEAPEAREELSRPVPVPPLGELGTVGRALESMRRQLLGESAPESVRPVRRRPGVRSVVLICALLIAAWGVPLLLLVNRVQAAKAVPAATVADQQARTEAAADRVRQSLDESYTDLTTVATTLSGQSRERTANVLRRALAGHAKYRSLYVLDHTGAILTRVGEEPLRTLVHAPTGSGITRVNTSGRIPSIAAYAQIPSAKTASDAAPAVLFAEIDVNALNSLLSRPGLGSVWLTDEHHRVLAASVGFQAFQALPSQGFTRLVAKTEAAPGNAGSPVSTVLRAETTPGAGPSVAAAAPLARTGRAAGLDWRVVSAEPAMALKLTAYQAQSRTMLAGLLALAAGIACLGWLHIVVVRPLRALAGCAQRLADGDRRTVLYPVHHDECGSVTRSLELLRQALADRGRGDGANPASASARSSRCESAPGSQRIN
ncbi:HAMP domain-containing protein [Streptomyces sp. NPDC101150]|uniref:HAMP domain-containing protein n=1 Tax=Streptomyces sp. NPDC101150 TaxID=3366114 RepID=UPI0038165095